MYKEIKKSTVLFKILLFFLSHWDSNLEPPQIHPTLYHLSQTSRAGFQNFNCKSNKKKKHGIDAWSENYKRKKMPEAMQGVQQECLTFQGRVLADLSL